MNDYRKTLARNIAHHCIRNNTYLESLHCGKTPSSRTDDFSDVLVITPYGEIPWNAVSRISDKEMRTLMLQIEKNLFYWLRNQKWITDHGVDLGEKKRGDFKEYLSLMEKAYEKGISWDWKEFKEGGI